MMHAPSAPASAAHPTRDTDVVVDAVLGASRALVAVAARSLATVADDVTLAQYRVLIELAARGPLRLADLASALTVERSTATRMCDRLVRKRLVTRRRSTDDRRVVSLHLAFLGIWFVLIVPVLGGLRYGPLVQRFGRYSALRRSSPRSRTTSSSATTPPISSSPCWQSPRH